MEATDRVGLLFDWMTSHASLVNYKLPNWSLTLYRIGWCASSTDPSGVSIRKGLVGRMDWRDLNL
jgi:hypothetical protein